MYEYLDRLQSYNTRLLTFPNSSIIGKILINTFYLANGTCIQCKTYNYVAKNL